MGGTLKVPPQAVKDLQALATMPAEQFARLSEFVERLPPEGVFSVSLGRVLESERPDDRDAFFATLNDLGSMMRTAERVGLQLPDLVDAIITQTLSEGDENIRELHDRLSHLLENPAINTHVRAWELLYEEQRYINSFRIVTDLRPVFDETGEVPRASVIVNHLHVSYIEDGRVHNIFFALDEDDISQLTTVASRAFSKISALKKVAPAVASSGVEQ